MNKPRGSVVNKYIVSIPLQLTRADLCVPLGYKHSGGASWECGFMFLSCYRLKAHVTYPAALRLTSVAVRIEGEEAI